MKLRHLYLRYEFNTTSSPGRFSLALEVGHPTHRWTRILSGGGGGSNTPRHASCKGNRDKLQPFGPLARVRLYLDLFHILVHALNFRSNKDKCKTLR